MGQNFKPSGIRFHSAFFCVPYLCNVFRDGRGNKGDDTAQHIETGNGRLRVSEGNQPTQERTQNQPTQERAQNQPTQERAQNQPTQERAQNQTCLNYPERQGGKQ